MLAAFALAAGLRAESLAAPMPAGNPTGGLLVVAGPPGGRLDQWADCIMGPVGRALPGRTPLVRQNLGGLDGVTAANQFEARGEPDGSTALLVPGSAALSWLVGEVRAKFDPARWVPLWAGVGSAILVSRQALTPGRTLRVAAASPVGPELPALLALDMLGVDAVPSPPDGADALLIQGQGVPAAVASAAAAGFRPAFCLGVHGPAGEPVRDPLFPQVPTAGELVAGRAPVTMMTALESASAAVLLEAGLVLPQLTPAAAIAAWRAACSQLSRDADVLNQASRLGMRIESGAGLVRCTSGLAVDPTVPIALRQWLATRYGWRPA